MAIAQVGNWTSTQFNNSTGGSVPGRTSTAGNLVVITATASDGTATFTHSQAGTIQTARTWANNGSDNLTTRYIENIVGGASHTITITCVANSTSLINATEYSGMATSTSLDKTAQGTGNSASLLSAATTATAQADELLIGAGTVSGSTNSTWTAGASYTLRGSSGGAALGSDGFLEDRIVAATGTYTAAATWSGAAGLFICTICTFKAAAAGAPNTPWMRFRKRRAGSWIAAAGKRAK